jgi:hypothetical protein
MKERTVIRYYFVSTRKITLQHVALKSCMFLFGSINLCIELHDSLIQYDFAWVG